MSDAKIDTGDSGDAATDLADNLIGDLSNAGAVRWYGLYSFAMFGGALAFWVTMNGNNWVAQYGAGINNRMTFYLAAAMAWIVVSLVDTKFTREIYRDIIAISVIGPFFSDWVAWGNYFWAVYNNLDLNEIFGLAFFFLLTFAEQVIQIQLLPQVFNWASNKGVLIDRAGLLQAQTKLHSVFTA